MDNDERRENYELQRGTTLRVLAEPDARLTPRQQRRLKHKENSRKTHSHAPGVHCDICRQPASATV